MSNTILVGSTLVIQFECASLSQKFDTNYEVSSLWGTAGFSLKYPPEYDGTTVTGKCMPQECAQTHVQRN